MGLHFYYFFVSFKIVPAVKKEGDIESKINHIDVGNMIGNDITVQNIKKCRGRPKKLN